MMIKEIIEETEHRAKIRIETLSGKEYIAIVPTEKVARKLCDEIDEALKDDN